MEHRVSGELQVGRAERVRENEVNIRWTGKVS